MQSNETKIKVMVVEDDPVMGKSISQGLVEHGYECQLAASGAAAVELAQHQPFGLIILDLALEDDSGLGVLRCLRETSENANIIILTPLNFQQERIAGLEAGADDFVLRPFSMNEIRARIEAALVRSRTKPKTLMEVGPLRMDLTARRVTRNDRVIALTPTEFRILEILMRNVGKVVTRRMLCEFLWNPDWEGVTNVIEVHINRLRTKISVADEPRMIHTVRGSGYALRWDGQVGVGDTDGDASEGVSAGAATQSDT